MINDILSNTGRFIFFIFLQGLILNDLNLFEGMAIPYLYIVFILMLPIETPRWLELVLGFICGLVMDMFTNTIGIHASACLTLAFIRPLFLKSIAPRDGYEFGQKPTIAHMGFAWYIKYAGVLILIHHSWLFFMEVYSLNGFFITLTRAVLSSVFTLILAVLTQYLAISKKASDFA
jgi:rod shape-determining protein MreD